jgi:tripartite ATP-independent transporter DctM subunit
MPSCTTRTRHSDVTTLERRPVIERAAAALVSTLCAVILAAGVVLITADVFCRYVLSDPIQWADELAIAVLIAITFLGAALTLYRSEHQGVRIFRNALTGGHGERADGFAAWIVLIVAACLTWSSVPLLDSVDGQTTTSGLLPASINYYPLLAGGAAMTVFAVFHLARIPWRALVESGAFVGLIAAVLVAWGFFAPAEAGTGLWVMVALDAVCLAGAVPVAFALAAGSLSYMAVTSSMPILEFANEMQTGVGSFILLSIPFFVLAGLVMGINGMSRRLIDFLDMLVGGARGGLSVVMVVAMAVFSGISGSKSADVAAVGSIMMPAMRRTGYREDDAVALLAASAVMGETIPPCINMIILGYAANVSIAGLFIAGLLPAAVMAMGLILVAMFTARRGIQQQNRPHRTLPYVMRATAGALGGLAMILIIVVGIVGGIATPTEVSAVAVVYALIAGGLLFREMTWRSFADFLARSSSLSGMILFIIASAELLSYLLTINLVPQTIAGYLAGVGAATGTWAFLLIAIGILIVMGSVLEGAPALIIFGPLLLPAAQRLGVNPLHFGILLIIAMGIGLFAPPLGIGLYTACAVGEVPMERVAGPIMKYLAVIAVALLLIAFVPSITLALPHWVGLG